MIGYTGNDFKPNVCFVNKIKKKNFIVFILFYDSFCTSPIIIYDEDGTKTPK